MYHPASRLACFTGRYKTWCLLGLHRSAPFVGRYGTWSLWSSVSIGICRLGAPRAPWEALGEPLGSLEGSNGTLWGAKTDLKRSQEELQGSRKELKGPRKELQSTQKDLEFLELQRKLAEAYQNGHRSSRGAPIIVTKVTRKLL